MNKSLSLFYNVTRNTNRFEKIKTGPPICNGRENWKRIENARSYVGGAEIGIGNNETLLIRENLKYEEWLMRRWTSVEGD